MPIAPITSLSFHIGNRGTIRFCPLNLWARLRSGIPVFNTTGKRVSSITSAANFPTASSSDIPIYRLYALFNICLIPFLSTTVIPYLASEKLTSYHIISSLYFIISLYHSYLQLLYLYMLQKNLDHSI